MLLWEEDQNISVMPQKNVIYFTIRYLHKNNFTTNSSNISTKSNKRNFHLFPGIKSFFLIVKLSMTDNLPMKQITKPTAHLVY